MGRELGARQIKILRCLKHVAGPVWAKDIAVNTATYVSLRRLERRGLVKHVSADGRPPGSRLQRRYALTKQGHRALHGRGG